MVSAVAAVLSWPGRWVKLGRDRVGSGREARGQGREGWVRVASRISTGSGTTFPNGKSAGGGYNNEASEHIALLFFFSEHIWGWE